MKHWFSDLKEFRRDPLGFLLEKGTSESGSIVRLHLGPPVYMVVDPQLIKSVLKESEDKIDKGRLVQKLRVIIGDNSLTMSGEKQADRRAAIHEQLARGMSLDYVPQISAIIRKQIFELAHSGSFNAHKVTAPLALRIISSILFGPGVLSHADENALIRAIHLVEDEVADSMFRLVPTPVSWFRKTRHIKAAREIMHAVVTRARGKAHESSLLRSLMQLSLNDMELCDEILMLFLAGHHTTGAAAAWVLYFMAVEEGLQERLADEADSISDETGEFVPDKLFRAPVSSALVREVMRLYPSAWWFSRELKTSMTIDGHRLRPGTSLIISPWHLGRDPRYWQKPYQFDLTRSFKNPAFIPFGSGPRSCVGMRIALMELQLLALNFAASYRLHYRSQYPASPPKALVALTPPEMKMSLMPRDVEIPKTGSVIYGSGRQARKISGM